MLKANETLLINEAGSVNEGVRQLLQFARMSVERPDQLIQYIARQRGINLAALAGQPGAPQQPGTQQAPGLDHLSAQQQRIEALEHRLASQSWNAARDQIAAFASSPDYPYFEDVRAKMGELIEKGTAGNLQEAYEMATWGNPALRAQLMAQQAEKSQAEKAAGVARARAANAASLTGSPVPGVRPNGAATQSDSIRDSLVAAFNDSQGNA